MDDQKRRTQVHRELSVIWTAIASGANLFLSRDELRIPSTLLIAVCTFVLVRKTPMRLAGPFAVLTIVLAVGAQAQARQGASPASLLVWSTMFTLVILVTSKLVSGFPERSTWPKHTPVIAGFALMLFAFVVRFPLVLLGHGYSDVRNGQLDFGMTLQVGEFSRLAFLVGLGIVLFQATDTQSAPAVRRLRAASAVLIACYTAPLMIFDQGPAVLIAIGSGAIWLSSLDRHFLSPARIRRAFVLGVPLLAAGVVAMGLIPQARTRLIQRMAEVQDTTPTSQLGYAINGVRQGGLVGRGFGSSNYIATISESRHDMLPSALATELGTLALAAVIVLLMGSMVVTCRLAQASGGARGFISAGLIVTLIVQGAWSVLASLAVLPITGLSVPVLVVTGSTILPSALVLGLASGSVARGRSYELDGPGPAGFGSLIARGTCAVTIVAAVSYGVSGIPPTSASSFVLARGDILSANGVPIARWNERHTGRSPRDPKTFGFVGSYSRVARTATGVELATSRDLTCGGSHSLVEHVATLIRPLACHPAEVVTTVDTRLQLALSTSLKDSESSAVVIDTKDGSVRALGSTFDRNTPEGAPGSTLKILSTAAILFFHIDMSASPLSVLHTGEESLRNIGGMTCPDHSIETALTHSCNSVVGFGAVKVGQRRMADFARAYFGADMSHPFESRDSSATVDLATGLDGGSILSDGSLARSSIGQEGTRATALGMAQVASVVVNGLNGRPAPGARLIAGICTGAGFDEAKDKYPVGSHALPTAVAEKVYRAMAASAKVGSASRLQSDGHSIATKTGTADSPNAAGGYDTRSWLIVIVDKRWVIAAQAYEPGSTNVNFGVAIAQRIIDALPSGSSAYSECPA